MVIIQLKLSDDDIESAKVTSACHNLSLKFDDLNIIYYETKVEMLPLEFFETFHIIICCLDNIDSRQWVQNVVENINQKSDVLLIDCGSEEFQGHISIDPIGKDFSKLFSERKHDKIPICTISNSVRSLYHIILYSCLIQWPKIYSCDFEILNEEHLEIIRNIVNLKILNDNIPMTLITSKEILEAFEAFTITSSPINSLVASLCVQKVLNLINGINVKEENFLFINAQTGIFLTGHES